MMGEIFGYYPNSVKAFKNGEVVNCTVRYDEYDVNLMFVNHNYKYLASISCENDVVFKPITTEGCALKEFTEYYNILKGNEQPQSYDDFFAPVYIINAIKRSLESGNEEVVKRG